MKMSRSKNGRSKLRKEVEPSATVTATLSFDRDGNVVGSFEATNVTAGQSPVVPSDHQSRLDVSTQDSLNLDYHSTLCTQTQDGGVEVTWDWHSPGRKAVGTNGRNIKTHETSRDRTPKRAAIIHKKRMSNSPLMYKPLKRKLIKQENTDGINKFKAELIALSEKIKNAQDEKFLANRLDGIVKDDIPSEIEFDDSSNDATICNGNEMHKTSTEDRIKQNNNFDELFDDSLNDTMIKCSQEIEERLNIAPANLREKNDDNTFGNNGGKNFLARNKSYCRKMNTNENKLSSDSSIMKQNVKVQATKFNETNAQKLAIKKHKSDVIVSKTVLESSKYPTSTNSANITPNIARNTEQQQLKPQNGISNSNVENTEDLHIPDDSFDEFLATCDEDFSHSDIIFSSTSTNRYGKIYDSKHSESPKKSNNSPPEAPSKSSSSTPMKITSNVSKGNTMETNVIPNVNIGNPAMRATLGTTSSSSAKRDWKFFKSKSHSDSSFTSDNSKVTYSSTKSPSQIGLTRVVSGSSVSTEHQIPPIRRTTSCLNSNAKTGKSIQKVNAYNTRMYHVNRCVVKEDGDGASNRNSNSGDVASSVQSLQLCGPEEIARKRMEAKMKLEAKKKRGKINSNSFVGSRSAPVATRNKR